MKKISQMNTDELGAFLCEVAEPVSNLVTDAVVIEALTDMARKMQGNKSMFVVFGLFSSTVIPIMLGKNHKEDTYKILAAVSGKTVDEIRSQNGLKTAKEVWELLMTDRDMGDMFRPGEGVRAE